MASGLNLAVRKIRAGNPMSPFPTTEADRRWAESLSNPLSPPARQRGGRSDRTDAIERRRCAGPEGGTSIANRGPDWHQIGSPVCHSDYLSQ
jgi:hypothetical protein